MKKNWIAVELGTVLKTTSGGTPSRRNSEYYSGNIPWVKSGELNQNTILDTEEKISDDAVKNSSAKLFPKGTLLIALYGATIGKLAFLGIKAATNQAVCGIFEDEGIYSRFLYYFLFHNRRKLVEQGAGGAQPNISQTILKNLPIVIAPLPEQRAIVARIEELFSELDHSISNLKSAQAKLEIYRQAVLKKAFEGGFTSNTIMVSAKTDGWRQVKLGEILKVSSGKGLTSSQMDGGIYSVYGGNGKNGNHSEFLFQDLQLIIGRVGVRCGVTHITSPFSWVTDNALIVNFKNGESHDLKFMKLKLEFENLNKLSNSTAQPVISGSKIYDYEVLIPGYLEQNQIVQEIESRLSVADKMAETIEINIKKSESLRQSILKKAFEGKLLSEVELVACRKEADWEPAEKLLERIRSQNSKPKKS